MSEAEIFDELLTLVAAGHETTMIALAWALYWLHRTPAALARLREELDALPADPDPDALARLPYLDAVLAETLRLYPVVHSRRASSRGRAARPSSLVRRASRRATSARMESPTSRARNGPRAVRAERSRRGAKSV